MTKHPHTPGPWTLNAEASHPWIVECPQTGMPKEIKGRVCTVGYRPNATLIAAAPDMAAALQSAKALIEDQFSDDRLAPEGEWLDPVARETHAAICAALAKAGA